MRTDVWSAYVAELSRMNRYVRELAGHAEAFAIQEANGELSLQECSGTLDLMDVMLKEARSSLDKAIALSELKG